MKRRRLWLYAVLLILPLLLASCVDFLLYGDVPDEPPQLTVVTETGTFPATRFGYRWETKKVGVIADSMSPFEYEFTPIEVNAGTDVQLVFASDAVPYVLNVMFYPDGEENAGSSVEYEENTDGNDPRFAEDSEALFPVTESGIFVVDGLWPVWVKDGINGEAQFAFAVTVLP